jgi:hypothetical protein
MMEKGINMTNDRSNFRVSLPNHILGKTTVDHAEVCVLDFSAGGMGFQTTKPMELGDVLSVTIEALDRHLVMVGQIVRRSDNNGMLHYGLKSLVDVGEMTPWVKLVNDLNFIQKKQPNKMKYVGCNCKKD